MGYYNNFCNSLKIKSLSFKQNLNVNLFWGGNFGEEPHETKKDSDFLWGPAPKVLQQNKRTKF